MWARVSAAALAAVMVASLLASGFSDRYELTLRDSVLRLGHAPPRFTTAVLIDEASLREHGPWPWPRATLAALVERAKRAGARAVVIDLLLADSSDGDSDLAEALGQTRSVLVAALDADGEWILPATGIRDRATLAHSAFELDHDGVLRRFAASKQSRDTSLPALPFAAAAAAGRSLTVPSGRSIVPAFRVRPRDIPSVSAADALRTTGDSRLRDTIVFVGFTAHGLGDRVVTPVSSRDAGDPGVLVHAAATEALLAGATLYRLPPWVAGIVAALIVLAVMPVRHLRPLPRRAAAIALMLAPSLGGFVILARADIETPVVTLTATAVAAVVVSELLGASAFAQRTRNAVRRLAEALGVATRQVMDEDRLEELAELVARRRSEDAEAKRVLAHELKTPLASVRNLTQLLADFDLSEEERRRVTRLITGEADKLQATVDSLLALEKLALRDFATTTERFDGSGLLVRRLDLLRAGTARAIRADIAPSILLRGDPALIERAVDNLVANAVKYSPATAPVTVRLRRDAVSAFIEVEDSGPGIAPDERDLIFRRFARGRAARGTDGLGLGLALVAEVTRWHGGTPTVDTAATGGSIFRLTLPLPVELPLAEAI